MSEWLNVINQRKKYTNKISFDDTDDCVAVTLDYDYFKDVSDDMFIKCPKCKTVLIKEKLKKNDFVCYKCNCHFQINSEERLYMLFDQNSIKFLDESVSSCDPLHFPNYKNKLKGLQDKLNMSEGVVTGKGSINNEIVYFGIMDFRFIMGSMGSGLGEKLTRMIEKAYDDNKPVVIFTASGGARVQEGMLSLYQMVKVTAAIEKHSEKGLLYISVLTDPTMGGVTASFASVADVIIAEPNARIGFAGKRVIEGTVNEKLPDDFQTAEFLHKNGMIDIICNRNQLRSTISNLISIHNVNYKDVYSKNNVINLVKEDFALKHKSDENTAWNKVQIARNINRPNYNDYISKCIDNFIEVHGDRNFGDDSAVITGVGYLNGIAVTVISNAKGKSLSENISRNFGMAHPEGYRKVMRVVNKAEKFAMPVICFIDTPGAYCGIEAEKRGQGEAIAECIKRFTHLSVPVISVIIGEGGSGGALATGVADYIFMLENSVYSVISPEGCASILFNDSTKANEASEYLKITAEELLKMNIIDEIIPEPKGGAQNDTNMMVDLVKCKIYNKLIQLIHVDGNKRLNDRYKKFRTKGIFEDYEKLDINVNEHV